MRSADAHSLGAAARMQARGARGGRHVLQLLEHAARGFFEHRGSQLAAAISYYGLFATFPIAILAVAVFGLVLGEQQAREDVLAFLDRHLPVTQDAGREDLRSLLRDVTSGAAAFGAIGLLGLAFSASGLMGALRNGVNVAWAVEQRRPPLRGKALDVLFVACIGILVTASLLLTFGTQIASAFVDDVSGRLGEVSGILAAVAATVGVVVPALVSWSAFAVLYRFLPARRPEWRAAMVGALVAAVGFELVKRGFGLYLGTVASYGAVYGSLATAVAFAFFVFLSANVFLLGAEAGARWPAVRAGEHDGGGDGKPLGRRVLGALRGLVISDEARRGA